MKIISCENFALQSSTLALTATTDTIVKCGTTGKRYYWTGSAFAEYFEFSNGGNISVTPLAQALPKASISGRNPIDTPYYVEPIDNINRVNASQALPVINNVYARAFIAPHTGLYSNIRFQTDNVAGATIRWAIYSDMGALIGQGSGVADSSYSNGWISDSLWRDTAGVTKDKCGVNLVGGQLYYIAVKCNSITTKFFGFSGLPNLSVGGTRKPLQAWSNVIPADSTLFPSTVTFNGSNQTFFPYCAIGILGV